MANQPRKQNVTIQHVLAALLDDNNLFPPAYLRQFSDLEGADLESLRSVWAQVSPQRRVALMEDLENLNDSDLVMLFDEVAKLALSDSDPRVRVIALRMLWENGTPELAATLLTMLREDPASDVRAAAASTLGSFVYLGELEEIPEQLHHRIEDALLAVLGGQDETLVRRRALEALGFSGRGEVEQQIRKAFESEDTDWQASALFAMGRSANNAWAAPVIRSLRSTKMNILLEAVRAAGELELQDARQPLLRIATEEMQDGDLRDAAFWSLSKIGGDEVREAIEQRMEETDDEEEVEYLEGVLDSLTFTEDFGLFDLFDMDALGEESEFIEEDLEAQDRAGTVDKPTETPAEPPKASKRKRHSPRNR